MECEALGNIYGVQCFRKYLYGKRFKLITDHKLRTNIFGSQNKLSALGALRLQRWAALLSANDYEIVHNRSEENSNADYLSQFVVEELNSALRVESNDNCYSVLYNFISKLQRQC